MTNPWTEAWAEAQASAPANLVELFTLEMLHPSFVDVHGSPSPIRVVRDTQDHSLLLEASAPVGGGTSVLFTCVPFEVPWPEIEEGRVPELKIRVDNVGRELAPYVDAAILVQAPVTVIFRVYLWDSDTETAELGTDPISFSMREITVTETYVEGTASPADLANLQFLRLIYDVANFPTLSSS